MHDDHSIHPIPVSLLTSFLGSGKTTVLNRLLRHPELTGTAVIINEFGEIGLDHELVETSTENMVLHHHHHHDVNRHDDRISAVAYTVDDPIPAAVFDLWLETVMRLCGPNILRLKGIVNVEGAPAPFVLNGV